MNTKTPQRTSDPREAISTAVMTAFMAGANAAFFLSVYTYTDVFAQIF